MVYMYFFSHIELFLFFLQSTGILQQFQAGLSFSGLFDRFIHSYRTRFQ